MSDYPLIGISGSIDAQENSHFILRDYMRAILWAGGVPLLLSPDMEEGMLAECVNRLQGVMFAGGNDIAPALFGQTPIEKLGEVNPLRDRFETQLVKQALRRELPVLGICRGIQVMNAAMGGTLYQDLPSQFHTADGHPPLKHSQTCPGHYASHRVHTVEGTLLNRISGATSFDVNSFHHQAIDASAPGLRISATAVDGVSEGLEHPELPFFLGVQWHPERMFATDAYAGALFQAFVESARCFKRKGPIE